MKKLLLGLTTITLALFSCSTFQKTIPYQDSLQGRIRQHLIKTGEKETGKMYTDSSYEYRYKTLIDSNNVVLVATMLDQDVWQEDYRAEVLRRKKHKLNPNIVFQSFEKSGSEYRVTCVLDNISNNKPGQDFDDAVDLSGSFVSEYVQFHFPSKKSWRKSRFIKKPGFYERMCNLYQKEFLQPRLNSTK